MDRLLSLLSEGPIEAGALVSDLERPRQSTLPEGAVKHLEVIGLGTLAGFFREADTGVMQFISGYETRPSSSSGVLRRFMSRTRPCATRRSRSSVMAICQS